MEKKISVKNIYLLMAISFGLIALGLGSTYAVFTASAEINNPITFTTNLSYTSDIIEAVEVLVPKGEMVTSTLNITNSTSETLNYTTWYTGPYGIYTGVDTTNESYSPTGTIASGSTITILVQLYNSTNSSQTITLGISASANSVVKDANMLDISRKELQSISQYITVTYNEADKYSVQNDIEQTTYQYASDYNLFRDDFNNIRYYDGFPDNYIYFNCDDYLNQSSSTCELWRIIGVFNGKVKLIRNSSIGSYSWDTSEASSTDSIGYGKNDWTDADLMKLLNPGYTNQPVGGSLYYNSLSGTCYNGENNSTTPCDFTNTGIKETTKDLISDETWYLGGYNDQTNFGYVNAKSIYNNEHSTNVYSGNQTTWSGKISILNLSDYSLAVNVEECNDTPISLYNNCTEFNWIATSILKNNVWLLTHNSVNKEQAFFISTAGNITAGNSGLVYSDYEIVPTLYLEPNVLLIGGNGTSKTPYQIIG